MDGAWKKMIDQFSFRDLVKYAVYPDLGNNLAYPTLGLIDEITEFVEKGRRVEECFDAGTQCDDALAEARYELADVAWYISDFMYEFGCALGHGFENQWGTSILESGGIDLVPGDYQDYFIDDLGMAMMMEAGSMAGIVKKYIRGDSGEIPAEKVASVYTSVSKLIHVVNYLADRAFDMTFNELVQLLHKKLSSRQERGVLKGDGDNR